MRVLPAVVLAASTSLLSGCGPVLATYLVVDAEAKLAAARASEAEAHAIYEYVSSEAYLKKAHEELGYADYGPAIDYAYKAGVLAAQGAERARDVRTKYLEEAEAAARTPGENDEAATDAAPSSTTPPPPRGVIIKKVPTSEGQPQ
jgi:hypothetical protein